MWASLQSIDRDPAIAHVSFMPKGVENFLERTRWGAALKALRDRAKMTQEAAGERVGLTRQGWGLYELGKMKGLFEPDMQTKLAGAVGATRSDLQQMFERIGRGEDLDAEPRLIDLGEGEGPAYVVPVSTRVRFDERQMLSYDIRRADAKVDLSWLFGPDAGFLRMAGSHLGGLVESGELVVFDRSVWPDPGRPCVIETIPGATYVYEYQRQQAGTLFVTQRHPEATIELPMTAVRGVYAVRLRGA